MEAPDSNTSPLEAADGTTDAAASEAFKRLANEKRLAILLALWETHEPFEDDQGVPFSVPRKRVGMRDKGQFNYHLDKLDGHFVRKTDGAYELTPAGHRLVRTVIAGAGIEDESIEPTEVDLACYLCGAPTAVSYRDQWLFWVCTECDGLKDRTGVPGGTIGGLEFDPAGLSGRSPAESLDAAWTPGVLYSALAGVCDACSGPMDGWLHVCEDHVDEGVCPDCDWRAATVARFRCSVCKQSHAMVPWWLVVTHPAVVSFYYDHGIALQYEVDANVLPQIERYLQAHHRQELVSEDPPRVRVTIQYGGDELQLTLDGELDVVEVRESG